MTGQQRVAWITGAGRGIGRSCALVLARDGCGVALSSRSITELEATAAECRKLGARAVISVADVTDPQALAMAYGAIVNELGAPNILVNAAGGSRSAPFLKTDPSVFREQIELNLLGAVHASQLALPQMVEKGWGRIVNIASVAARSGAPYISAYAASKHALLGLTRSLAAEYAKSGVTVNAVCPGYVNTRMTEENVRFMAERTRRSREDILARLHAQSPQARLIEPDEVAAGVAYLCRDEAKGVNGQALTIDGGSLP